MHAYYVYIMTNASRTLYTGVTNDLQRRVHEHRSGQCSGFTAKYQITQLVFYETTNDIRTAIGREKETKGWRRAKKITLIEAQNPAWRDFAADWP
ncbi:MAG: GIY-YIG nuclease family protein [Caldilineaceae bacterium]|nr:GIY-YIG nuclease family protein [Caldilineaceae bacterium]